MPGITDVIRRSLAFKVSLTLAVLMIVLTAGMAVYIIHRQAADLEETTLTKAKLAANQGAKAYGLILEQAIDNGALLQAEVFDRNYLLIEGYDWGQWPRYHTKYDSFTDQSVLLLQDKFLEDPDVLFAVGVDNNGYLPTHNIKYMQSLTGDPEEDKVKFRAKRIFNDEVGLAAAKNETPGFLQSYQRDQGERVWDVSSPIYVKGKHWGGFRIAILLDNIDQKKASLRTSLFGFFGLFALVVIGAIFILIRRAMKPVEELTVAADKISMGEALDVPLQPKTIDEIGILTKSIDRLRSSMKAAMERLGE
jgi:HAMP domain-containing protein